MQVLKSFKLKLFNSEDDEVSRLKEDVARLKEENVQLQSRFRNLESKFYDHRRRTNSALGHSYTFVRRQLGDKDIYEASDGSSEFTEPLEDLYLQNLNISFNSNAGNQAGEKAEITDGQMMEIETIED